MDQIAIHALLRAEAAQELASVDEADERSNEQKLIDALDLAALRFSSIMLDDRTDESGKFLIDWDMRVEVFKMVKEWVATRRRTDIDDPKDNQKGVAEMQRRAQAATSTAPEPAEKRGRGRPTNAEVAERKAREEREREERAKTAKNDDSGWQARLAKANGSHP